MVEDVIMFQIIFLYQGYPGIWKRMQNLKIEWYSFVCKFVFSACFSIFISWHWMGCPSSATITQNGKKIIQNLAEPPKMKQWVTKSQLVPQLLAGLVLGPLPCRAWWSLDHPPREEMGDSMCECFFLSRGKKNSQKELRRSRRMLLMVFCKLYSVYVICARSGNKSS